MDNDCAFIKKQTNKQTKTILIRKPINLIEYRQNTDGKKLNE